jgi:arylsulfatase A-like enzyme
MASLLTGRVPAAHEDGDGSPLGIAPGIPTIAEDFGGAGWATAAFVANPTLRIENGFSDGFTTFFTTPYEGASITLPASETLRRVPPWLEAHRGEPLFLWVHLMDPHDPYAAPDRTPGRTPFDPGYAGVFRGDEVNRLQLGDPPPASPADARHLEALYHDEVRYADSEIGRLWDGEPDRERSRWTVVFTSDHGEEFGEHGGWKHGPALYDEVLRVPLAIRPGAARRGPAIAPEVPVSLLDVVPTLEALAGLPPARRPLDGLDLLDPSSGERSALPPVTMLTGGAPRAAVVRAGEKLFFFDRLGTRGIPDASKDPAGHRLAIRLPRFQPGLARFDLAADPGEKQRLPIDRSTFAADWQSIERAIAHTRRGLEIRVAGTGAVRLRVVGLSADAAVEPFALEENDRFERTRASSGAALEARPRSDRRPGRLSDPGGARRAVPRRESLHGGGGLPRAAPRRRPSAPSAARAAAGGPAGFDSARRTRFRDHLRVLVGLPVDRLRRRREAAPGRSRGGSEEAASSGLSPLTGASQEPELHSSR